MTISINLSDEQRDALLDLTTISMGEAGDRLGKLLDTYVDLSTPHVEIMGPSDIAMALHSLDCSDTISGVCQGFIGGGIAGEAMIFFNDTSFIDLAHLMNYDDELDEQAERELLMDTSNVLIGACIKGLAEHIDHIFSFGSPLILGQHLRLDEFFKPEKALWNQALVTEINYRLEGYNVNCDLLMIMTESSIDRLLRRLDILLN